MRAVPVAIEAVTLRLKVVNVGGTPLEFPVRGKDTGINNIGVHALTVVVILIVLIKRLTLLINAVEPPRKVGRRVQEASRVKGHLNRLRVWRPHRDGAILYNERDLRVSAHRHRFRLGGVQAKALERYAPGERSCHRK